MTTNQGAAQLSISVFGPINSGKSTLVGYLSLKTSGIESDWSRRLAAIQNELGRDYDPSQKLAYIVDTGRDERLRGTASAALGQSKRMHTAPVALTFGGRSVSLNAIDTPGLSTKHDRERERYVGMYLGDIGIFLVEAKVIADKGWHNRQLAREFFAPLIAWTEFKSGYPLAVILSKSDESDFSRTVYDRAVDVISEILGKRYSHDIPVIPASIDVDLETDENLLSISERTPWAPSLTLASWIGSCIDIVPTLPGASEGRRLCCIEGAYENQAARSGVSFLVRGKVLFGRFHIGDDVQVSPVRFSDGTFGTAFAKIRSLRQEKRDITDLLSQNEIGGLGFVPSRGSRDFELLRTSCLFGGGESIAVGSALSVVFSRELDDLEVNEQLTLIWFGKLVDVAVAGRRDGNNSEVVVIVIDSKVSLTRSIDPGARPRFYFRRPRAGGVEFVESQIAEIGSITEMRFRRDGSVDVDKRTLLKKAGFQVSEDGEYAVQGLSADSELIALHAVADALRTKGAARQMSSRNLLAKIDSNP